MKKYKLTCGLCALAFTLVLTGCWVQEVVSVLNPEPFYGFSSMEIPYIGKAGEKRAITFYREDLISEMKQRFEKFTAGDDDKTEEDRKSVDTFERALNLLYGDGVRQDTRKAAKLLESLAKVNKPYKREEWGEDELYCHMLASYLSGLCYLDGVGVRQDEDRGLYFLKRAFLLDEMVWEDDGLSLKGFGSDDYILHEVSLEMSVRYLTGEGITPNVGKGIFFLTMAARRMPAGLVVAQEIWEKIFVIEESPRMKSYLEENFPQDESMTLERYFNQFEGISLLELTKKAFR